MYQKFRWLFLLSVLLLVSTTLVGCNASTEGQQTATHDVVIADVSAMPSHVQSAPQKVRDAYRFAATHGEVLQQIPCYCGCGAMGHGSNYACFWQENGQVDDHALNCGICTDIAEDVRRGLARGQPLAEIRAQVDSDYSRFGPPTDTAPVAVVSE